MKSVILLTMYKLLIQKGLFQQLLTTGNCCIPAAGLVPSIGGCTSDTGLFYCSCFLRSRTVRGAQSMKERRGLERLQLLKHFPERPFHGALHKKWSQSNTSLFQQNHRYFPPCFLLYHISETYLKKIKVGTAELMYNHITHILMTSASR